MNEYKYATAVAMGTVLTHCGVVPVTGVLCF